MDIEQEPQVFLPTESTGEDGMIVKVKEEIIIEDVADDFDTNSLYDDCEGEVLEPADSLNSVKEEIVDTEVTDNLETKFPFVHCEYRSEDVEENPSLNPSHPLNQTTHEEFPNKHSETDPLSLIDHQEIISRPTDLIEEGGITSGLFSCTDCEETFRSKQSLGLHRIAFHIRLKLTSCHKCEVTFSDIRDLDTHVCTQNSKLDLHIRAVHTKVRTYKCSECSKWFSQCRYLKQHQRFFHPYINPFKCQKCSKSYVTKQGYTRHQRTHSNILIGLLDGRETDVLSKRNVVLSQDEDTIKSDKRESTESSAIEVTQHIPADFLPAVDPETEQFMSENQKLEAEIADSITENQSVDPPPPRSKIDPTCKQFICEECGRLFTFKYQLDRHQQRHKNQKLFKCNRCIKSFSDRSLWLVHRRIHRKKPFECPKCEKTFMQNDTLFSHLELMHSADRPFHCNKCDEYFSQSADLMYHQRIHGEVKNLTCKICGQSFLLSSELMTHEETHPGIYTCDDCGKCFALKGTLRYHLRKHVIDTDITCELCYKRFTNKRDMRKHQRKHVWERRKTADVQPSEGSLDQVEHRESLVIPSKCIDPAPSRGDKAAVRTYSKRNKPNLEQLEDKKNDQTLSFAFIDCGESYPKLDEFIENVNDSQTKESQTEEEWKIEALKNLNLGLNPFPCNQCDRSFLTKESLTNHKLAHSQPFVCKECGRAYFDERSLLRHLGAYHSHKYKCEDCKKIFNCESALQDHKNTPFRCEVCCQVFRSKWALEAHLTLRTGVKSFSCRLCDKIFSHKSHLIRHEVIHLQKPFRCINCDKCFSEQHELETHQSSRVDCLTRIVCSENIMITGIPKNKRENEKDILQSLGKAIGLQVDFSTVMTVHRIPQKNKDLHPNLVARFINRELRDMWLQKFQEKKILLASDINQIFPNTRITIEEHLTLVPTT